MSAFNPVLKPDEIREQLNRILASTPFKNSKRYRSFLRHVVEETLNGRSSEIKERNIAVDIFSRAPDYDTASDPVVRVTAGEVRKRLAQYYDDDASFGEIRILLPSGTYVPQFCCPERPMALADVYTPSRSTGRRFAYARWLFVPTALACFAAGLYWPRIANKPPAIDRFWDPVWNSSSSALVSIGELGVVYDATHEVKGSGAIPGANDNFNLFRTVGDLLRHNTVSWADSITASELTGFVDGEGKHFRILRSRSTSLVDLKQGPAILVGGFNNKWIMRLMAPLRFRYRHVAGTHFYWIEDRQSPARKSWSVDNREPPAEFKQDFGIVARFWDPATGQPVVVASGIAAYGTIAAGEFLTDPKYMDAMAQRAPSDWQDKNLEIVFVSPILGDAAGAPRILAAYFW